MSDCPRHRPWLHGAILRLSQLERLAQRGLDAAGGVLRGYALAALSPEEQSRLNIDMHQSAVIRVRRDDQLFAWEQEWFRRQLPAPPGPVLVGAAGAGREAIALAYQGYRTDVLEPAPRLTASARAALGPDCVVVSGSYADLVSAVNRNEGPARPLAGRCYAAILLGWGSLSYVLDPASHLQLLIACTKLAPTGPILASFLVRGPRSDREARSEQLGRQLAGALRTGQPSRESNCMFTPRTGFLHLFTPDEIDGLGARIGRRVIWESSGAPYPHVTFLPG
jgi:hypothetical protein